MSAEPLLSVEELVVSYGAVQAVKDVSLDVRKGEIVTVLGSNGAGKSSLLKAIVGLTRTASGRVRFKGQDITIDGGLSAMMLSDSLTD